MCIYPTPLPWAKYDTKSIFEHSKASLNSEVSLQTGCQTKAKKSRLSYYLPIAGGGRRRTVIFLKAINAMRNPNRIWTRIADSITNNDNRYANHAFILSYDD